MYGIFYGFHVGKYTNPMDPLGYMMLHGFRKDLFSTPFFCGYLRFFSF